MTLPERLASVRARIDAACAAANRDPTEVELVAVSKNHPLDAVRQAMQLGQVVFGENRVQELAAKAAALAAPAPIWHMIGSVQTNKVRDLLATPGVALVHSVDRPRLAAALQAGLAASARSLACLLEVNAPGDPSKHGVAPEQAEALLRYLGAECPALSAQGLMAMGPITGDPRPTFARVARLAEELRQRTGLSLPILSLGMSGDFEVAIAAGSTMVRIGTGIFGPRLG